MFPLAQNEISQFDIPNHHAAGRRVHVLLDGESQSTETVCQTVYSDELVPSFWASLQ